MSRSLDHLRRSVASGENVEVEDVLALVKKLDARDAGALRDLASRLPSGENGDVPLRSWADSVALFLESGPKALVGQVRSSPQLTGFAAGVLETAASGDATAALLDLGEMVIDDPRELVEVAASLNQVLSFELKSVPEALAPRSRSFLHRVLAQSGNVPTLASAFGALRRVGDKASLEVLSQAKDLPEPWKGVRRLVISQIRRRIRA